MRTRRGKSVAILAGVIGLAVVCASGFVLKDYLARRALLREIEALEGGISPTAVLLNRSVPNFKHDGPPCISLCRDFLARWPRDSAARRVRGVLLRMLDTRTRHGDMLKALGLERTEARQEVVRLASAVVQGSRRDSRDRDIACVVLLDADLRAKRFENLREFARELLSDDPSNELAKCIRPRFFQSYMDENEYRRAADYAAELTAGQGRSEDRVLWDSWRRQALEALGDLDGLARLAGEMQSDYPGLRKSFQDEAVRKRYDKALTQCTYWLAFVQLARGRYAEARRGLEAFYAGYSGYPWLLDFTKGLAGKRLEAPPKVLWGAGNEGSLRMLPGRVTLLQLLPRPGRSSPTGLLQALDRLQESRGAAGLNVVLLSPGDPEDGAAGGLKLAREFRERTKDLDLSLPWGLVDREDIPRLFPSDKTFWCVLVNRDGRFTWCTSLACGVRRPRWTLALGVVEELLGQGGGDDPEKAP